MGICLLAPRCAWAGELQVGVERIFGVAGFIQIDEVQSDFGHFRSQNQGIGVQLFATSSARGDGQDGVNSSAVPRLVIDYQWDGGWSLGGSTGFFVSSGRREVDNGGVEQDPYVYRSHMLALLGARGGKEWRWGKYTRFQIVTGPLYTYLRGTGDGLAEHSSTLQLNLEGRLVVTPHPQVRLIFALYGDFGVWGRSSQKLQVSGVPATQIKGSVWRHGLGLSMGGALAF